MFRSLSRTLGAGLLAFQYLTITTAKLVVVLTVLKAGGVGVEAASGLVAATLTAWAIGAVLQSHPRTGSGRLMLCSSTYAYLGPALIAVKQGGMALVCGMTAFAGIAQMLFAHLVKRFPRLFTPSITGPVLVLLGFKVASSGLSLLDTVPVLGLSTFLLVFGFYVWGGALRPYAILLALAVTAWLTGWADSTAGSAWFAVPTWEPPGFDFDSNLLIPFMAMVTTAKTVGLVGMAQADEPCSSGQAAGSRADGLSTLIAGLLGTVGQNVNGTVTALAVRSGIDCRRVAYFYALACLALASCPTLCQRLLAIPSAVEGGVLVFASGLVIASGFNLARGLTRREAWAATSTVALGLVTGSIGLALCAGMATRLAFGLHPEALTVGIP